LPLPGHLSRTPRLSLLARPLQGRQPRLPSQPHWWGEKSGSPRVSEDP
jgi:hypothetical protein